MGIDKKKDESYQQWRDRTIDKISPSFCGAKWYNATIWLNSGSTASCHHPPAHKIPVEEVQKNFKAIHNTKYKKMVRKQMLDGERPKECDYCFNPKYVERRPKRKRLPANRQAPKKECDYKSIARARAVPNKKTKLLRQSKHSQERN